MSTYTQNHNEQEFFVPEKCFVRGTLRRLFPMLLGKFLPRKTKRLIFISTFIACANGVTNPSKAMLSTINELLRISDNDSAIALPMLLGYSMWMTKIPYGIHLENFDNPTVKIDQLKDKELNHAELRIAANTVLSCSPRWLMYDSKRIMRADIVAVLGVLPKLAQVQ